MLENIPASHELRSAEPQAIKAASNKKPSVSRLTEGFQVSSIGTKIRRSGRVDQDAGRFRSSYGETSYLSASGSFFSVMTSHSSDSDRSAFSSM